MVVFRYHDLPHHAREDMINAGLVEKLGWKEYEVENMVFRSPYGTLGELTNFLKHQFGASTLRVVGSSNMNIATIGILPGAYGRQGQVKAYNRQGIDVLIVGEAREWETIEYARDAIEMGRNSALIVLGHADSEEPGMEYVGQLAGKAGAGGTGSVCACRKSVVGAVASSLQSQSAATLKI
jgi:putative NIF3 family GTP cyclohydrolase 1 type 2